MFQPETEDMLPRMAPKPSSDVPSGASEEIVRPQVPEVSLLYGQQNGNVQIQSFSAASEQHDKNIPQQTYAAWKLQMLPKVTLPVAKNVVDMPLQDNLIHNYNSASTNPYPFRTIPAIPLNMATSSNLNGIGGTSECGGAANQLGYRRSLESCDKVHQQMQHLPTLPSHCCLNTLNPLPNSNSRDVLTICAGTQTDAIFEPPKNCLQYLQPEYITNLASKKDVESICQVLDELKVEQKNILNMLEKIILGYHMQTTVKLQCRDIGIQVDCTESKSTPCINGEIDSIPNQHQDNCLQPLMPSNNILHTPKDIPIAHSTTYRPKTPQFQMFQHDLLEAIPTSKTHGSKKHIATMPKSASDTSLVMNELAMKYLPNEKLSELLKEFNMNCPLPTAVTNVPTTPVCLNIDKSPSDISNASYKYLKKYRLLPEDHEENNVNQYGERTVENDNENCRPHVCNTLANQRLSPTNKWPQYAGRLPLSPLVTASPISSNNVAIQNVNLENIKHQPKFL